MFLFFYLSSFQKNELTPYYPPKEANSFVIMNSWIWIYAMCFDPWQFLSLLQLKFSYLWPLGTSSSWLLCHFDITQIVFDRFLAVWYDKIFQDNFCHRFGISHFFKKCWFSFSGKWHFITTISYAIGWVGQYFWSFIVNRTRKYIF